ncbi:DUF3558 domain-containing protein [Nocardia sp. N2S4-5]|uniref:DUF3558 domain-containing protein n=1 Tax=Nocardia sp. N2S4-5 TaxID=3351565 RepID=UPI0037CF3FD1
MAVLTGCNSGGGESVSGSNSTSATPTVAADVPAGFDACTGLPQALLQAEQLKNKGVDNHDGGGGTKWRGCIWIQSDGYGATIDSTNITLPAVRANREFTVSEEMTIGGRPALTSFVGQQDPHTACTINVEIKGGSVEIAIDNPSSRRKSGSQHACDIAKRLADGIAPAIPSSL